MTTKKSTNATLTFKVISATETTKLKSRVVTKAGNQMDEQNKAILDTYQSDAMKAIGASFLVPLPETVTDAPKYKAGLMAMLMRKGHADRYVFQHPDNPNMVVVQRDVPRPRPGK
jgi:hypothetical protein